MRFLSVALLLLFLAFSAETSYGHAQAQKHESLNQTDEKGYRQGYWQITGQISVEGGYKNDQIVEEGNYIDNKREGIWKKYYPTGVLKSEITYFNNYPKGAYKVYYPNGQLEEESIWMYNKNKGSFRRYHENGKIAQEFNFGENGKRNGVQKYYYPNGKPQMTVEVKNGVANGLLVRYNPDGTRQEEQMFVNGEYDPNSLKTYSAPKQLSVKEAFPELPKSEVAAPAPEDKPNLSVFDADGFNTLYNKNLQISQVGQFKNGKLHDGKWYRYDENGLLRKIEIYKEGQFIGYGIIEEDAP